MKKNFNTRLCNDLFPEMPQSFMDGLQNAMKKADAKPRKHVLRKILIGASAAVLAAACALVFVFGVIVRNRSRSAADPVLPDERLLVGVWKQTRSEHAVDPSPLDGFDYDYLKWEKEQTWEEDAKPQPWYLEFTADGRMNYFLYAPDGGVQGNQSAPYTISGNTLQWSGWTLRYEAETDTICWIFLDRREYYERVPDAVIDDPYRQKISDLRKQYPEYFDLYATPRLKVIVWQMAEGSYSCALVPGSDLRKEAEIGIESRGTTIEEMRMILSTYYEARDCNIEPEQVEVVPFQNPISSYAYEIDETYTGRVRWLLTGIPFECDDPLYSSPMDSKINIDNDTLTLDVSTVCDVDGDGRYETCMLTYGPTSGLFTFTLSVYRNGTAVYRNTFQTAYGYFRFQRMTDGLNLYYYDADSIKTTGRSTAAYAVTIENGAIVLTNEKTDETVEYWGLDDPHWNMNALGFYAENLLTDTWCATTLDPDDDGLLSIAFYGGKDRIGRSESAAFTLHGVRYEGYSYTVKQDESSQDTLLLTFTNAKTGDVRSAKLVSGTGLFFEVEYPPESGRRVSTHYVPVPEMDAKDLPLMNENMVFSGEFGDEYQYVIDFDGDGTAERLAISYETTDRILIVQDGLKQFKAEEIERLNNVVLIDLDADDGRINLLLDVDTAEGERIYELHVENGALVLGGVIKDMTAEEYLKTVAGE